MKIGIVGYGRMGKHIEAILKEKNIEVASIIDCLNKDASYKQITPETLNGANIVIDFSAPETVMGNICRYVDCKVNVVMGTTGWYENMEDAKKIIGDSIGFIWSGNFSMGVHLFFKILRKSAQLVNKLDDYEPLVHEFHHKGKIDSPSGTAHMLGDILLDEMDRKDALVFDKLDRKIEDNEIHVSSSRGGFIHGTHKILFDSPVDTIEITHTARSREGFAHGAIIAAKWLHGKKGFFTIDDYLNDVF